VREIFRSREDFTEMKNRKDNHRAAERGGASVKFLIVIVAIILIARAGYNYVPVAYEGEDLKQEMDTAVVQAMALGNNQDAVGLTKTRIQRVVAANGIPTNAFIEVKQINNLCQARVAYQRQVELLPFGLFSYTYEFDHVAVPSGFLAKSRS
jgi:hypothetical protein